MRFQRTKALGLVLVAVLVGSLAGCRSPEGDGAAFQALHVEGREGALFLKQQGEAIAEYRFQEQRLPGLYSLRLAGGLELACGGESACLWFAHGDVDGHDFWAGPSTRVVNGEAILCDSGSGAACIRSRNLWMAGSELVLVEYRRLSVALAGRTRRVDLDLRLSPAAEPVTFGEEAPGGLGLCLRPGLAARDSEGRRGALQGERARWVALQGVLDGGDVTVLVLDHPENPGHPARFWADDTGRLRANSLISADGPQAAPPKAGLRVEANQDLCLGYRVVLAPKVLGTADLEAEWERFAASPRAPE
jgi:hypothetical protein